MHDDKHPVLFDGTNRSPAQFIVDHSVFFDQDVIIQKNRQRLLEADPVFQKVDLRLDFIPFKRLQRSTPRITTV